MTKLALASWLGSLLVAVTIIATLPRDAIEMLAALALPIIVCVTIIAVPAATIVWTVRAIFGLYPGLIVGRIVMALLSFFPAWLTTECLRAMNVPPTIVDDHMYDNDGTVRSLFFLNAALIPSTVVSLVIIWLSNRSFLRRLKGVSSATAGAQI